MDYDIVVVGGGPAGLSAAITAAYYKLNVLVLDSALAGGAPINQYPWKKVDNYLGLYGKNGLDVAKLMVAHARSENVKIRENEAVENVRKSEDQITVTTGKGSYTCKALVIACGLGSPRKSGVEGENLEGVSYCLPEPEKYTGKKILVVGGGDTAVECAVELKKSGADVSIAHRRESFRATEKNVACIGQECVNVLFNTEVKKISGAGSVEVAVLFNNKENTDSMWELDAVLFSLGTVPNTEFLQKIGIKVEGTKVVVDQDLRTNIKGIFAAGDVVGKWIRIPEAIGEGGLAGLNAFKYVKNPYWG